MKTAARMLGWLCQALVLGTALAFAVGQLLQALGGAPVFRYQGF